MDPAYSRFNDCLEAIATTFPDLGFKLDGQSSTDGDSEVLYRGINGNTQHMVVCYLPRQPMIHVRVYDPEQVESVRDILNGLRLNPRVGDQYLEFGKIDIDAFLN